MHINDLMDMVEKEVGCPIQREYVDWESGRTQQLHQKYRKLLYFEKVVLNEMKSGMAPLIRDKKEYYTGKAPEEVYKEKPFPLRLDTKGSRVLREELSMYLDADPEIMEAKRLINLQEEKVEYLKDTLNDIIRRSFHLSNIMKSLMFKHGLDSTNQILELDDPEEMD
jgi:hypothetical protein